MASSDANVLPTPGAHPTRGHIIWIDSDVENRDTLAENIRSLGIKVTCFRDGPGAIDALRKMKTLPDFMFLELILPSMTGLDVLKNLRKTASLCDLPAVVISAHRKEQLIRACLQLGIKDFLLKPIEQPLLQQRLECLLIETTSNQARTLLAQCTVEAPELLEKSLFRRLRNKGLRAYAVDSGSQQLVVFADDSFTREQLLMLDEELFARHVQIFLAGAPWIPIWPRGSGNPPPQPVAEDELLRSLGSEELFELVNTCAGGKPRVYKRE